MEVNGVKGLVSMVVQRYVGEVVHKHMVGLVGNYKGVHHIHHLGMHPGMALDHSNLVEVGCHKKVHHNYCPGMHHKMVVGYNALDGLLPRGLIKSLWLLPSLILPTLMPVLIIASIPSTTLEPNLKPEG